jgi:glycosyltransferase involved in cell wall biosynthesis
MPRHERAPIPLRLPPQRMHHLTVAVDVAPLHGHRTGVGVATAGMVEHLDRRPDVTIAPFLVSYRARPVPPQRRLPLPAGLAMRAWAHSSHPRADRWLGNVDVVHGTNYVAPPSRLPTVVSVYDCWFLTHPDEAAPAVRRAARVLQRAVRRGARVHVSSAATASAAAELLSTDRISVVHLGPPPHPEALSPVDATTTPPDFLGGHPFIVAIGTTERRKDLPSLVKAFGSIASSRPDLRLVVAGAPGDDHEHVLAAVGALDAPTRSRVHVTGRVDGPTKQALLAGAEALVYPSLDEGFGFPVLEAQRAGTPVVARRAGSIPEVAGDAAVLVDPGSSDALAEGIVAVIDHPSHRDHLRTAGGRNVARFSWERCAAEMIEVYRLAIEEQS